MATVTGNTRRTRRYRQFWKAAGLVRVELWVPAHAAEQLRDIARELRDEHERNALQQMARDDDASAPGPGATSGADTGPT